MENLEYFKTRRTIRKYEDREINDEMLSEMLTAAQQAPNTGNMQLYSVIVTRDTEMKERLSPLHFNQPSVKSADVVLTFCADVNRFAKWCAARKANAGFDNFQALLWSIEDATILAQQFVTIAELNGLGTCYLGSTVYTAPQISELLKLPKYVVPVITVTVGYPDGRGTMSNRLPLDGIIHKETYADYNAADIDRIYKPTEVLPENQKFIAENGKETLAQVFAEVRYARKDNEYFSKVFVDYIEGQGFKLP